LSSKSGMTFDKSYISSMLKDHEDDIAAFEKEANGGSDEDVKAFAAKNLTTLREHLRMAQEIARQLGVSE
jgi:putative membrane protein